MNKLKVVFLGTPDFSVPTLQKIFEHPGVDLVRVISMPDRPAGRGQKLKSPPVIEYAKNNNIAFSQTENINKDQELIDKLGQDEPDVFIVLAFAQFLGSKVLAIPSIAPFNIHTSLLPKYRGAAPIQYALLNGDNKTGVSIQRMVKKMDAGDIVYAKEVPIHPEETGGELWEKLQKEAAESCVEFLNKLLAGEISYCAQDETQVSFAPTISKEDGHLDFQNQTRTQIRNKIRAFDPWPGTYFFLDGKRMKIYSVKESIQKIEPGKAIIHDGGYHIGCLDGSLELEQVQYEGKAKTFMKEFLNGYRGEMKVGKK